MMEVQWFELFDTTGGEMRLSFFFRSPDDEIVAQRHFTVTASLRLDRRHGDDAFRQRLEEVEFQKRWQMMVTLPLADPWP